jgi:hypothetical protein
MPVTGGRALKVASVWGRGWARLVAGLEAMVDRVVAGRVALCRIARRRAVALLLLPPTKRITS